MNTELEQLLTQELRQVAEDVRVPTMPHVTETPSRPPYPWIPLLVAAVIATIVAGAMLLVPEGRGHREAPPVAPKGIPTSLPTVPYVEGGVLRDGDRLIPGTWKTVAARGDSWAALRKDGKWFWDLTPEVEELAGVQEDPALSPNGKYMASGVLSDGNLRVQVFETRVGGEGLGVRDFPSGGVDDENHVGIVGVTNTGEVVLQSVLTRLLWIPDGNRLVDLSRTTDQWVHGDSDAGLIWGDGLGSDDVYVGDVDEQGHVTRRVDLPNALVRPNADASYGLAEGKVGNFGDEVVIETVVVHDLHGGPSRTVRAPEGWRFVHYAWESDQLFFGAVVDQQGTERTARCSVREPRCVLLPRVDREPGRKQSPQGVSTGLPESGFLVGEDLYFRGRRVPGRWVNSVSRGDALIAQDSEQDWFMWRGDRMEREEAGQLTLSPDGRYGVSASPVADGKIEVKVFTIRDTGGEAIGTRSFSSGPYDTEGFVIVDVNDAGLVLLSSIVERRLWNPDTDETVRLQDSSAQFTGVTPAGWVWRDEASGESYLGSIDAQGRVAREIDLPDWEGLEKVNPAGTWLLDYGPGSHAFADEMGGNANLDVTQLGGPTVTRLAMPSGWYATRYDFESDSTVLAEIRNDGGEVGLVRCDLEVLKHSCVQVDLPD